MICNDDLCITYQIEKFGMLQQVIRSHMEMFSEVQWKKSNATTQELVCYCRSESVLRSVN